MAYFSISEVVSSIENIEEITSETIVMELDNCNIIEEKIYRKNRLYQEYYLEGTDSNGKTWKIETSYRLIPSNCRVRIEYLENYNKVRSLEVLTDNLDSTIQPKLNIVVPEWNMVVPE